MPLVLRHVAKARRAPPPPVDAEDPNGVLTHPATEAIADLVDASLRRVQEILTPGAWARALDMRDARSLPLDRLVARAFADARDGLEAAYTAAHLDGTAAEFKRLNERRGERTKPSDRVTKAETPRVRRKGPDRIKIDAGRSGTGGMRVKLEATGSFTVENPLAAEYGRDLTANLVTRVGNEIKTSIRAQVARGWGAAGNDGRNRTVDQAARDVRQLLSQTGVVGAGLTAQQERALNTQRNALLDAGKSDAEIERACARYAETMRRQRSVTIARTEVNDALNAGQQQAWEKAAADGVLGEDSLRVWIATPGSKTCPVCNGLDGKTAPIDKPFKHPDGREFLRPPAHPNCRCSVGMRTEVPDEPGLFEDDGSGMAPDTELSAALQTRAALGDQAAPMFVDAPTPPARILTPTRPWSGGQRAPSPAPPGPRRPITTTPEPPPVILQDGRSSSSGPTDSPRVAAAPEIAQPMPSPKPTLEIIREPEATILGGRRSGSGKMPTLNELEFKVSSAISPEGPIVSVVVYAPSEPGQVASVDFRTLADGILQPSGTFVRPDYRRMGVATEMYARAERATGAKVVPDTVQTPEAQALWANPRRAFGLEQPAPAGEQRRPFSRSSRPRRS